MKKCLLHNAKQHPYWLRIERSGKRRANLGLRQQRCCCVALYPMLPGPREHSPFLPVPLAWIAKSQWLYWAQTWEPGTSPWLLSSGCPEECDPLFRYDVHNIWSATWKGWTELGIPLVTPFTLLERAASYFLSFLIPLPIGSLWVRILPQKAIWNSTANSWERKDSNGMTNLLSVSRLVSPWRGPVCLVRSCSNTRKFTKVEGPEDIEKASSPVEGNHY